MAPPLRDKLFGSPGPSEEPIRILIADDDPQVRAMLKRTLEDDPRFLLVGEAVDGAGAIAQTTATKPDVIILDLAMPNTNGMQAIPDVLQAAPATRIVVFSSMAPFGDTAAQAMELGAVRVLDKYTPPKKLVKALLAAAAERPNGS